MGRGFSTSRGRILLALTLLFGLGEAAAAVEVTTTIQPQRIAPGEPASLQVRITDADEAQPLEIPSVDGLSITFNGAQRFSHTEIVNWKTTSSSGVVLTFSVVPERGGRFDIPPVVFKAGGRRYRSKAVSLLAVKGTDGPRGGNVLIKPEIALSRKNACAGEPVLLRYYILHTGMEIQEKPLFEQMPDAKGFMQKAVTESLPDDSRTIGGTEYIRTHIGTFILIPAEKGVFRIGGGSAVLPVMRKDAFFSFPQNRRITFGHEELAIAPLPENGKPKNFQGNVGRFTLAMEYDRNSMKVFDEKRIRITVKGQGNLLSLAKPYPARKEEGVKIIEEEGKESLKIEEGVLRGEKEFIYTFIPERSGKIDCGGFVMSFYDPGAGYAEARTDGVILDVQGGGDRKPKLDFDKETAGDRLDVNILLIAGIILLVAGAVVFVVMWEKRRYQAVLGEKRAVSPGPAAGDGNRKDENYAREMFLALRRKDRKAFFSAAEKALNHASRDGATTDPSLEGLKERIYTLKYGGAEVTEADMIMIYDMLKEKTSRPV